MSDNHCDTAFDKLFVRNMLESALRIGVVLILLWMAHDIVRPFLLPIVWGGIIAIAAFPLIHWLQPKVGGKRGFAVTLLTLFFIFLLVVPSYLFTESMIGAVQKLSANLNAGSLSVSAPPAKVAEIPLIGDKVYELWQSASKDLDEVLELIQPQLKAAITKTAGIIGHGLVDVLVFVASLLIAGVFMTYAESSSAAVQKLFVRLGGQKPGGEWAGLSVATVRSVLQGLVGVAIIQAVLCAIGFFAFGVPGAAIWTIVVLVLAIAQLPALIVVGPIIAWAFSASDGTSATIFAVWMVFAGASDNILKPILMGRGLNIPMPVILVGALGGMVAYGIIGLFAGAVVLSIIYRLYGDWLEQECH